MHPDLLDILSHQDTPIDNQQLTAYLTGKLNAAQEHELEKKMADNGMSADALEGLQLLKNKQHLSRYQHDLNMGLHEQLRQSSHRKKVKPQLLQLPWLILLSAALIALMILVYFMVHSMQP